MEAQNQKLAHPLLPREFWEALYKIYRHYLMHEFKNIDQDHRHTFSEIWQNLMCLHDYLEVAQEEGWFV